MQSHRFANYLKKYVTYMDEEDRVINWSFVVLMILAILFLWMSFRVS
jgi:hypothetical protein